ncbi:hypothetical protein AVEN_158793-1 [Araneus ventricosus]|uniref:C2H2-type domain-containing protein n=1 Tax=Araneus ventricosus TaxID=182803 RepID=A0A4Y2W6J3_ARAVE|nr:hypothetical protein AVEN_158793-1 [Araneus ventricosus]
MLSSSRLMSDTFSQASPREQVHREEHIRPAFRQSQAFLHLFLQLQDIIFKRDLGAASLFILHGERPNRDKIPSQKPLPVEEGLNDIKETYYCDVCERLILGQNVWKIHLNSKRHQKRKAKLKRLSEKSNEQKCTNVS